VFFFSRSGTVWGLDGMALANDGQLYDDFGASVALFALGYYAAVGAPGDDPAGAVYIFDRNSGTWQQQDKIVTTDAAAGAMFGTAVAGMGFDHVAVGAPWDAPLGVQSGSAFVFRFDGSDWVQDAKLVAHNGTERDHFGDAVSLYSYRLLVGAPSQGSTDVSYGAVYAYSNPGGSWTEIGWRKAGDRCGSLAFGNAVVVGPDEALVAAKNYKLVYALDWEEVPQVFMDRFECGNTAAWSAVVP